jgi:hypothetical protein
VLTLVDVAREYGASADAQLWLVNGGWTAGGHGADRRGGRDPPKRAPGSRGLVVVVGRIRSLAGRELFWSVYSATSLPSSPDAPDACWLAFALAAGAGVHRLCRGGSRSLVLSVLEVASLIVAVSALIVALLAPQLETSRLSAAAASVMLQALLAGARQIRDIEDWIGERDDLRPF